MPWKNGGGVTYEIAVHPEGAGLDGFAWRMSMAEVAADGPFSRFDGVDRTLCLLDGEGIVLDFKDRAARIDIDATPCSFSGEEPVTGRLLGGPILDLNIMTRRQSARHSVTAMDVAAGQPTPAASWRAVIGRSGAVTCNGVTIGPKDCLVLAPSDRDVTLTGDGRVFLVRID